MGFFGFIKNAAKKIGQGVGAAAKWIGGTAKPFVHGVASAVEKYAPYVAGGLSMLGQGGAAALASKIGRGASIVKHYTSSPQAPAAAPSGPGPGPGTQLALRSNQLALRR